MKKIVYKRQVYYVDKLRGKWELYKDNNCICVIKYFDGTYLVEIAKVILTKNDLNMITRMLKEIRRK